VLDAGPGAPHAGALSRAAAVAAAARFSCAMVERFASVVAPFFAFGLFASD